MTLRRRFLVLLGLRWFQTGLKVPVLVLLLRARGLDLTDVGVVVATYGLTTALFELPTGGLADVLGRRPVLLAATIVLAAESVALALGQNVVVLALAAVLGGVGRALDSGPLEAWFVDSVGIADPGADLRVDLARAKSVEALAIGLGALTAGGLVAIVPLVNRDARVIDLSVPFLVSAGICLGMAPAIIGSVHDVPGRSRPSLGGVVRTVPATILTGLRLAARHNVVRRLTILMATLGVAMSTVELLAPTSLARILGGEDEAAGPYAVLLTAGFFSSAFGSSRASTVADRLRSSSRGIMAARLLGACALVSLATSSLAVTATAVVAFYALNGIARPLVSDILHRSVSSTERATILSVQSLTMQLAGVLAALAIGPVAQHVSFGGAVAIGAGVLTAGAMACISMPVPPSPTTTRRDRSGDPAADEWPADEPPPDRPRR